jgi:cardiolipin synthase
MLGQLKSAPNQLTLLRLVFVPFIATSVLENDYRTAIILLVIAGLTDALDGFLARKMNQKTVLGQYLDPIVDKMLLSTLFLVLAAAHEIPWRITITVFSRDIGILIVSAVLYATTSLRDYSPTMLGKANTFAQIIALLLVFLDKVTAPEIIAQAKVVMLWFVFILTVVSGLHYIIVVGNRLRNLPSESAAS